MLPWFPWFWRAGQVTRLRKVVSRIEWDRAGCVGTRSYLLLKAVLWPVSALVPLFLVWRRYAAESVGVDNRSQLLQLRELFTFTYWYGGAPIEYYDRKLYDEVLSEVLPDFISAFEHKILAKELNGPNAQDIRNKSQFENVCMRDSLPVLNAICHLTSEMDAAGVMQLELPERDLYLKPFKGKKGIGIERWVYNAASKHWAYGGRELDQSAFLNYCLELSKHSGYLLQVAVENHSSIAGFSLGPLVTFRVVTARYAEDPPVLIAGYCAIPRGQVQTNHEEYGGMVSKVNCETGRLEAAFSYTPYVEKHRQHPDTGAQIEGAQLDCWSEVVKLALAAHASFKDVLSIGWDIVYTPQGLYLLEGNTLWGLDPGLFLGRTEYVDICLNLWQDRHVSV